jgi:excisionase family DNA binding protein
MVEKLSYTIREAQAALGMGQTNLRKQIRTGRLAVAKVGRKFLVPRSEIEKWLREETKYEESSTVKGRKGRRSVRT